MYMLRALRSEAIVAVLLAALAAPATAQLPDMADAGCSVSGAAHHVLNDASRFGLGIKNAPRNAIRPANLKWELPIGAATGLLIAEADQPAAHRIHDVAFANTISTWSNVGLISEIGAGGATWLIGCETHHTAAADAGLTALTAMGAAGLADLAVKLSFNRQFPYTPGSQGEFWEGGRSFASGHAATSFAFASVIAHRYPHNRWIKWGAYAAATAVSLSRYPARRHYLSDILVGATLGYVTGTYMAGPEVH